MKIFDSHCHLDDRIYDQDIDRVLQRANEAEVAAVMIAGINRQSSERAVKLSESRENLYASVGVHPHDVKTCSEEALRDLIRLAESTKVRAWGEIGLDFNRMYSSRKDQEKWFVRQLEAAHELGLPLIFHERDSSGRFLEILKTHHNRVEKGVVHCFSGDRKELEQYLDLGLHIGITGILTIEKRGVRLRELAPLIPADKILVETDAPYLTPAPQKNHTQRNEPAFVKSVLLKLAQVRCEDPQDLSAVIWENTCRLFGIRALI